MCYLLSCVWLWNPMDWGLQSSSCPWDSEGNNMKWVDIPYSRGSSWPRNWTQVSYFAGRFFTIWATREEPEKQCQIQTLIIRKKKINFCNDKYLNTQRKYFIFSSFLFSRSVVFDHVWPHEPQHPRLPCPTPTPGAYPHSCLLSQWCHPTISSFAIPFFSCPQYFPASESFQVSQLFTSDGQNTGISASTSVLPMNTQDWSPLAWTGWISLQSKELSRVFSNSTVQNVNSLALTFLYTPTLTSIQDYWKNHSPD